MRQNYTSDIRITTPYIHVLFERFKKIPNFVADKPTNTRYHEQHPQSSTIAVGHNHH